MDRTPAQRKLDSDAMAMLNTPMIMMYMDEDISKMTRERLIEVVRALGAQLESERNSKYEAHLSSIAALSFARSAGW